MSEFVRYEDNRVFDAKFSPVSYYADDQNRLRSIEVMITNGDKHYTLDVEAVGVHMDRMVEEYDSAETDDDPAFVIVAEEILPSDLVAIKQTPFEQLEPFLVEQEDGI